MSGWQVTAMLDTGAVIMFGVMAGTERSAALAAMQRMAWFPAPWRDAALDVRKLASPSARKQAPSS